MQNPYDHSKDAIAEAKTNVPDMTVKRSRTTGPNLKDSVVKKLYFSNVF